MRSTVSARERIAGVILAAVLPLAAPAETAYITDRIEIGLHEEETLNSAVLELLPSGTPLEVLERAEQVTKVRTGDGDEGWVDAAYLTTEPPASARLAAENETVARMQEETTAARRKAAELGERLAEAERRVGSLTVELETARATTQSLETGLAEETSARRAAETALEQAEDAAGDSRQLSQALRDVQRLAEESRQLKQEVAELEANRAMVAESGDDREPAPDPAPAPAPYEAPRLAGLVAHAPDLLGFLTWQPWQWLLLVSGLALAFGAGGYVVDLGVRRRHGGFRI